MENMDFWKFLFHSTIKHEDYMKSIKMFTEKVMPHFKDDIDTKIKKVS